ncbi:hypothetical protein Tco_0923673 [Tanacetum coccineum]|uniref:Uncharacterized protein n=1 Tax=Tanacetum coccineum TaxID=301880 RepID=A0ABQ5D829_9ASTR
MGEGSTNLTDPHHTPTFIQPSPQPQKTQKSRKPKRKDTQVHQSSDPSDNVADETVHKELGDSLVRAATTASSLEAEQDSGAIETIGDTIAQTRFENVSKLSNDSLLARGSTLRSDEDRLKLNELMELCTTLQKKNPLCCEEDLGEDASKQGKKINAIDVDEDNTLVNVQDDADKEMFDVDALNDDIQAKIDVDYQLVQRLQVDEQKELSVEEKAKLFQQLLEQRRKHFAAKRAEEKGNKPPTQAQ